MKELNLTNYKLIISDFDGTLVDTFQANYKAYSLAFNDFGYSLSPDEYAYVYGNRWDKMCDLLNIKQEHRKSIHDKKGEYYKQFYDLLILNKELISILDSFRKSGGVVVIASTAAKENLINVLKYFNIENDFDNVVAGNDIKNPKPNPEIHNLIVDMYNIPKKETLIIEDSNIGFECAKNANIDCVDINKITKWN